MFDTDGAGGPLYGTDLMSSPAPVAYNDASDCSNLIHVLGDSGASDHYLDDFFIPELNRCFLDYYVPYCASQDPHRWGGRCSTAPAEEFFRASSPTTMATFVSFESSS